MKTLIVFLTLATITLSCPTVEEDFDRLQESNNMRIQLSKSKEGRARKEGFQIKIIKSLYKDLMLVDHMLAVHGDDMTLLDFKTVNELKSSLTRALRIILVQGGEE